MKKTSKVKPAKGEKKASRKKAISFGSIGSVREEDLSVFGHREMSVYADEVNLSRAVPDLVDGLKPVQRRIMWAASLEGRDFVKTARVVGNVIGRYHPHGDKSVSDAITVIIQSNQPTLQGKGNWGSLVDQAAAMRYTNCRLSDYGLTFFKPDYINKHVTSFVPNYDDTTVEPVSLPALLPNVLLNGGEGIGVGTTTMLPTFTPASVVKVLLELLEGKKLNTEDFAAKLKYANRYGGRLVKSKANRQAWRDLFSSDTAKIEFESELVIDRDAKAIEIDDWPKGLNPIKFINKVRTFTGVASAYNHKGSTGFRIEIDPKLNYAQFDKLVEKIAKATRVRRSFRINVTHRQAKVVDGVVTYDTQYLALSVPKLIIKWLRARIELETRSLAHRIKKQQEVIDYSKLLIYAASKLDVVFAALKQKDSRAYLVAKLKITGDQADQILDLRVRQLTALDQSALKVKLKDQEAHMTQLGKWLKAPRKKVALDTQEVLAAIEKDTLFEQNKERKMTIT